MKAPLFVSLAVLAAAFPLAAQSVPASLCGDSGGDFRDLGIVELVDAIDALSDPAPSPAPARPEAPDASLCHPDSLLFADQDSLVPGEPACPAIFRAATQVSKPSSRESSPAALPPPADSRGLQVARPASAPGSIVPVSQPVLAGAAPIPADQVPEPSALPLVLGAAAWILLRRKH